MRKTQPSIAGFENGRGPGSQGIQAASTSSSWEKTKPQILPRSPQKEHSPTDTLILAQTSDLQNWKIVSLCCFKPLGLDNLLHQQWEVNTCRLRPYRGWTLPGSAPSFCTPFGSPLVSFLLGFLMLVLSRVPQRCCDLPPLASPPRLFQPASAHNLVMGEWCLTFPQPLSFLTPHWGFRYPCFMIP